MQNNQPAYKTHYSQEDLSVNFTKDMGNGKIIEARFVRRETDYFICYLSSHYGCAHACRFCWLTQTGQTDMTPASMEDYLEQARIVLDHYNQVKSIQGDARRVNFNFMARGDALSNKTIQSDFASLAEKLTMMAAEMGLKAQFNISSILPKEDMPHIHWQSLFNRDDTKLYYSLYSLNPLFRKRWLPRAADPRSQEVIDLLQNINNQWGQPVCLHWSMIKGQNDDPKTIQDICTWIDDIGLNAKFNLVRYNPYSDGQGQEADEDTITAGFDMLAAHLTGQGDSGLASRKVPRVGYDVHASCGMFISS